MWDLILNFLNSSGIVSFFNGNGWMNFIMIIIGCFLLFLAIKKKYEPYLLLPIAIGMILVNIFPSIYMTYNESGEIISRGLLGYLHLGVEYEIYPCLIFIGIGATTDFGPLISNKKTMLLGAAAQIGIFVAFLGTLALAQTGIPAFDFSVGDAAGIGIIGGADGPTAILVSNKLANSELTAAIALAAYSYMALVPIIFPPIIKLFTTKKERQIKMEEVKPATKTQRILFPIIVTIICCILVPSCTPLIGCLMLGNLLKESGVVPNLVSTVSSALLYTCTILLGLSVGATAIGTTFLQTKTLMIFVLGITAFIIAAICGILGGKIMSLLTKRKVNPMIGAAGVSAVPMAARVVHKIGQEEDSDNYLLMHAMGPNVAGVIGSAIAAGILLACFGGKPWGRRRSPSDCLTICSYPEP